MSEPRERLVAHALIVGGVKGCVAGGLLGVMPLVMLAQQSSWSAAKAFAGALFAGGWLCALDAASRRVGDRRLRALLRFGAGLGVPLALAAPEVGILEIEKTHLAVKVDLAPLLVMGLGLGLGFLVAGDPATEAHEPQGCFRLLVVAVGGTLAFAATIVFLAPHDHLGELLGPGLIVALFVAFGVWIGENLGGFFARRAALWLEPEVVHLSDARAGGRRQLGEVAERLYSAGVDPTHAEVLRLQALDCLDHFESRLLPFDPVDSGELARRRAEALLGLGRLAEAEGFLDRVSFAPALRAELARRRGDLEGAAAIALGWLEDLRSAREAPTRHKSSRATAHAILALVRADQGRHAEARTEADAAHAPRLFAPAFEYLSAPAVERYLRDRAHV